MSITKKIYQAINGILSKKNTNNKIVEKNFSLDPLVFAFNRDFNNNKTFHDNLISVIYKNPVAVACINQIANYIRKGIFTTNIKDFFPSCSINNLMEQIVYQWLLYGNCFLEIIELGNNTYDLNVLYTSNITVVHNKDTIEQVYYSHKSNKPRVLDLNYVIHIKNYNPMCHAYGISNLEVASSHIYQYNKINEYMLNIAGRGGCVSGIVTSKDILNNSQRTQLKEQITIFTNKINQTGTVMVLENDMKWEQISISIEDLEMRKCLHHNAASIARAMGIPPILLGLDRKTMNTSGNQYNEARKQLVSDTLYPLYTKLLDHLSAGIMEKIKLKIDFAIHLPLNNQNDEM